MKFLSAVAFIATLISVNAFAGDHTINAVARAGLIYKDNDSLAVSNSSSFNLDYLRTTFAGVVSSSVKYFLTADLLGESGNDVVDGTSTMVDEAYITKTFSFGTSLIFGKKAVLVGGREYDYLNYDRYTTSAFFNATPINEVGVTLSHEIAGQTLMAQYFNGNKDNGTGTNSQSKFGYALAWYGSLVNGMIKPIIAYTVVPKVASASRAFKGNDNYLGAGIMFNTPHNLILELDYNLLAEKNAAGTTTATQDLKITSIVALVKYASETFAPFIKFISDENKLGTVKTGSRTAYDLGIEFKESNVDMIRYHIVYSGSSVKADINTSEVKSSPSAILVGLKFDAAILK